MPTIKSRLHTAHGRAGRAAQGGNVEAAEKYRREGELLQLVYKAEQLFGPLTGAQEQQVIRLAKRLQSGGEQK